MKDKIAKNAKWDKEKPSPLQCTKDGNCLCGGVFCGFHKKIPRRYRGMREYYV